MYNNVSELLPLNTTMNIINSNVLMCLKMLKCSIIIVLIILCIITIEIDIQIIEFKQLS